jgi:hypothetical protein
MWQKNFLKFYPVLLWLAILTLAAPASSADPPPLPRVADLFSLADLGPVDLSPKRVLVEVYVSPYPELTPFHRLFPQAWQRVANFYARMGILLEKVSGTASPKSLSPTKRLRLEVLTHKEWLDRTLKAFQVAPRFRPRFMLVCQDKYAFAHLNLSTIHIDFKHFQCDICSTQLGEAKKNPERLAHLIIHELGHLFGLYHAHEFVNDPIPEYQPDGKTPNFMSHYLAESGELGFVEFQRRLVHSYLSGGQVFQQYRYVDSDPLRYLELLKQHNNYQEPES